MKKILSRLMLLLGAFTMLYCTDEQVVPLDAAEDFETSIAAYTPNVFAAEITTRKTHPEETVPSLTEMHLFGTGGKIRINWGDGTIERVELRPELTSYTHQYDRFKNYVIKIDGDIKNIEYFGMSYQDVSLRNIYLSGVTGLKHLNLVILGASPETINLSHNKLIEEVDLVDLTNLKDVIIPMTNRINYISIVGCTMLSTPVVDRIVDRVYQSVVRAPRTGSFSLSSAWWEEDAPMVGPPSSYSLTKLRKLRDNYGWGIHPAP